MGVRELKMEDKINIALKELANQMNRCGSQRTKEIYEFNGNKFLLDCKFLRLKEKCKLCGKNKWEDEDEKT